MTTELQEVECIGHHQLSFADVWGPLFWSPPPKRERRVEPYLLANAIKDELRAYEAMCVVEGRLVAGSAKTYRKALSSVIKQAQRYLGRPLESIADLYDPAVIAFVSGDDKRLDGGDQRLARNTLKQRRTQLQVFIETVGLRNTPYKEAERIKQEGFRRASTRRGYRYVIESGRRESRHHRPSLREVEKVIAIAAQTKISFVGARNAAIFATALHMGLRASSMLDIDGARLKWRHGQLFVRVKVKGRPGSREKEVPPQIIGQLNRYFACFNGYAAARGWPDRIGIGIPGPIWRAELARPLTYPGLLAMVQTYTRLAGVKPFVLHGLRHLRAAILGDRLSIEEAAAAGDWRNVAVFLRHYATPLRIFEPGNTGPEPPEEDDEPSHEPPDDIIRERSRGRQSA